MKERTMTRTPLAILAVALLSVGLASPANADSPPPTNGGNGAGQSGQCTGSPDDRPPGLDCAH